MRLIKQPITLHFFLKKIELRICFPAGTIGSERWDYTICLVDDRCIRLDFHQ
jgi:hypothetical protein